MNDQLLSAISFVNNDALKDVRMGVEIEGQRTTLTGELAKTPHPFDHKLKNDFITVDFAENQLEFITKPYQNSKSIVKELERIRKEVEGQLNDEIIWPFSMPPILPEESEIPIARFGSTDEAKEKEIYRRGLAMRYGKKLQMISGIHFNFSIGQKLIHGLKHEQKENESDQAFLNRLYMRLARRFINYRWLLIYLFGASPVCHESYDSVIDKELGTISKQCRDLCQEKENFKKYATSIRLSRFGYPIEMNNQYQVSYQSINNYMRDLKRILQTESKDYQEIGTFKNGEQIQLNTRLIQNENEFYTPIRFKQTKKDAYDTNLEAIEKLGVDYVEVRLLDLDPYAPFGITTDQIDFLHVFMLLCLIDEPIDLTKTELIRASKNHQLVALLGRLPELQLFNDQHELIGLEKWAIELFEKLELVAKAFSDDHYKQVVQQFKHKITNRSLLPSEKVTTDMDSLDMNYIEYGLHLAKGCPLKST